jgi:hypothetical protein
MPPRGQLVRVPSGKQRSLRERPADELRADRQTAQVKAAGHDQRRDAEEIHPSHEVGEFAEQAGHFRSAPRPGLLERRGADVHRRKQVHISGRERGRAEALEERPAPPQRLQVDSRRNREPGVVRKYSITRP